MVSGDEIGRWVRADVVVRMGPESVGSGGLVIHTDGRWGRAVNQ